MKKIVVIIFSVFLCASTLVSQTVSTGFESLDYLYSISGKYTLAGQHGRKYWNTMQRITGDCPALWGEDMLYYASDGTGSMDQWRKLVTHDAKQRWTKGVLISMMFHACPPTQAEPCDWWGNGDKGVLGTLSNAQWNELITDGTTLNQNWKARLDAIYPYLKELDDAGVELLFRPLHEMNQGAFWWGGRPGPNGTLKLYQITHDYLVKTKGLTNLIWVWNVQDFATLATDLNNYDPGNDYWDVLALDVYWSDGTGYTTAKYNLIKNKAAGKPIAIGECDVLPSAGTLASQPLWTFFMGWAELTQQKNSDATIRNIYNASNVLTLSRTGRAPVSDNQDKSMICNFDNVFPYVSITGGLNLDFVNAPADSPASGQMGALWVPQNNPNDGFLVIQLDTLIDPRNYIGISFLAQTPLTILFVLKLEQTNTNNNVTQIQDWSYNSKYTGNGKWEEVHIGFDVILSQLQGKINANPNFPASDYDRIVLVPAPYQYLPAFTLNIDNVRLRTSWDDETGIQPTKNTDAVRIITADGTVSAKAKNGNPVSLKVYSISGKEISNGLNHVQLETKGAYIIKATVGNESNVSKVIFQ